MKFYKNICIALILSGIDFGYRSLRHLNPEPIFFLISFVVFLIISTVLFDNEKS